MTKDVLALAGLHFLEAYDKLTDLEQKNYADYAELGIRDIMPSAGLCRVATISRLALSRNSFVDQIIPIQHSFPGS